MLIGQVGITLNSEWQEPNDLSDPLDVEASERAIEFYVGWFANPIFNGDYPEVMKQYVAAKSKLQQLPRSRLPEFTHEEKQYIKGKVIKPKVKNTKSL